MIQGNMLAPWSRVFLENLTGSQVVKKFHTFYGTTRFITTLHLSNISPLCYRWVSPFSQATKALRENRSIALLWFWTSALEGVRGQRHVPTVFYPRERPGTHCTGGWVGPRAGLDRFLNLTPTGIRSPYPPARSQLLYRLSYRPTRCVVNNHKYGT
jgi:hypothetical protein